MSLSPNMGLRLECSRREVVAASFANSQGMAQRPAQKLTLDDFATYKIKASDLLPSSGVTIAPKGGVAHEATPAEARQIGPGSSWADVAGQAGENLIPSAQRFGSDLLNVVQHPKETGKALLKAAAGGVEKLIPGEQRHEPYADAVGQFFANRYGSMEAFKKTLAQDPVGVAADLATIFSGGELALARAPGIAGQIGRAAGTISRAIDPINAVAKGAGAVAKGAGHVAAAVGGVASGAGGQALRTAARAGFEGGEAAKAFRENMRGYVPMENVVADAKVGLDAIKQERQAAYRAGMADLSKDKAVLDFGKIDATLAGAKPVAQFKGISLNPSAQATATELAQVLDQWRKLDPKEFHTAEGFDALKQRIGDIRDGTKLGSASEKIATQAYNVVKDQIVRQAPQYAKTMKSYQEASDLIREIKKPYRRIAVQASIPSCASFSR
jgi:hypothetical protein